MPVSLTIPSQRSAAESEPGEDKGWFFSADVRLRTEYLAHSFRLLAPQQDHLQFSRSQLGLRYQASSWSAEFEVQDSRAWGDKTLSPIGTDDVNTLETINAKFRKTWQVNSSSAVSLTAGRMTLDYGSRRLLARNNFRNTSNAFQGVHLRRTSANATTDLFYTMPLQRRPDALDRDSLRGNEFKLDKAGRGERFWGASYDYQYPKANSTLAAYVFRSQLSEQGSRPVADRKLWTLGSRLSWRRAGLDMEAEAAYQWGESLAGILAPKADLLDHRAWFTHIHLGIDLGSDVNFSVAYDHATGDRDPFDGRNERFDRLYGARAFELGPSGIFGAAIRSNIRSPQLRLSWQATQRQTWLLSHRWLSLDSSRDFFVTGFRRDTTGVSGDDIGRQWELRWRWKPADSPYSLELGAAYLDKGAYFKGEGGAPLNPPNVDNTEYVFAQLNWRY
ncbi:alginate export family protein [Congregibacter variabilis]|uniref:Alginate export family protein n=1 Tax=Congregibacter variabilis TaxID=3081200 RepID=A0ABZ0I493_9GAMM|nr:alginate export family protein [Congregibacter sp. IMCC43200]